MICIVIPVLGIEAGGYFCLTTSSRLSGEAQASEGLWVFFFVVVYLNVSDDNTYRPIPNVIL